MGSVRVRFFGQLVGIVGKSEVFIEFESALTLRDLLNRLKTNYSGLEALLADVERFRASHLIFIDGVDSELLGGLDAAIPQDSVVDIVPVTHGG